jgi:hypothetical protein
MTEPITKQMDRKKAGTWVLRFIKFNIIGFSVFLVASVVFALLFPYFGIWTWLLANGFSSVLQFFLISYFNKKRKGLIFEQVHPGYEKSTCES